MKKRMYKLTVLGCAVLFGCAVQAETWDGGGADNEYSTALNWNNDVIPTNNTGDINGAYTVERSVDITVNRTFVRGGAVLNITGGTHSDSQVGNTIRNFVGIDSAGTVNQSGGSWNIGHILLLGSGGGSGSGTYNLTGGDLTVSRGGNSYMGVDGGSSVEIGVGSAEGLLEISGGSFATRIGVGVGSGGTFSVLGSAASSIGIGSNSSLDGDWNQASGGTLRVGIDAGGVTKILIDDYEDDGGAYAVFESGSLLDVDFYDGMTNGGTWTVLEVEGTNITDNGLAFASGVDTNIWSFEIDNSGANGLLTVTASGTPVETGDISSIAELRQYAASNNVDVTMTPGTYWMTGGTNAHFIEFSGSNNTFNLTDVYIKVDTAELAGYGSSTDVRMLNISGDYIEIDGLTLSMEKLSYNGTDSYGNPKEYCADNRSQVVRITGSYLTMKNCEFTSGGSYPYGYGDAFGKGSRPTDSDGNTDAAYISHSKQSGILFTAGSSYCVFENVTLNMRSFGHGIFFQQGAHDLYFESCQVLGDEMADSDDIIAHPEYQEWGFATYKEPIPEDIRISKHEGGFRSYGNSDYESNGYNQYIENITLTNCRVERMRNAVAMGAHDGYLNVYDMEIQECEMGYGSSAYGTTLYKNCKGDAVNGPVIYFQYGVDYPAAYEVELTGDEPGHGVHPIALISGVGNQITLTSSAADGVYSNAAYINTSQKWREWRHRPSYNIDELSTGNYGDATTGNLITNLTDQILVFGSNAVDNVECVSAGGVINKGSGNQYAGETLVPDSIVIQDTWTYPPNPTNVTWAQYSDGVLILPTLPYTVWGGTLYVDDADALGGSPDGDAGTTVSNGTIEVASGYALQGENLQLFGSGTAGQGAVYSDGKADNTTRLSSSSGTITLLGDTSIGVGVEGNELLMGAMTGTGSLTKIGPGTLTLEGGANSFDGAVIISNGWVKVRSNKVKNNLMIASGAGLKQNGSAGVNQGSDNVTMLNGTLDVNGRGDTTTLSVNIGSLTGSGSIVSTTTAATQTVNVISSSLDSSFDGTIAGVIALHKNGAGTTLELNGTCTHTAGTFVNEGLLGGIGSISGDVSIADGAGFAVDFSAPLTVGGSLIFDGSSFEVCLPSGDIGFDVSADTSWTIVEAGSVSGFSAEQITVDSSDFEADNALDGGSFSVSESGGDLILVFTAASYTAQEEWRYDHFGTYSNLADAADLADPDNDGINNLVEYGTGTDPNVFSSNSAAVHGLSDDGLRLTLTFNRIADPLLTYWVEANTNLTAESWSTIWSSTGSSNTAGSVTVEDDEVISEFMERFLRLRLMN